MKFIDEKGRLFGKLNIVDLLIVFIIIFGLIGVNAKLGLLKTFVPSSTNDGKTQVTFWVKKVSNFTADAIHNGDVVKELKSNVAIGKITNVKVRPALDEASDASGKWVLSEVPEKSDIFITIEVDKPFSEDLKLGSKDAKVGTQIDLKGPKFQVTSYITGVE